MPCAVQAMSPAVRAGRPSFEHVAVVYTSDSDLHERLNSYLAERLRFYDRILVIVPPETEALLRKTVLSTVDNVQWGLPGVSYRRLGPLYAGLRGYVGEADPAAPTLVVSESDRATTAERLDQYLRHEAAGNENFAWYATTMLCLADQRRLRPDTLSRFRTVHPQALDGDGLIDDATYVAPYDYLTRHAVPSPGTPVGEPDIDVSLTALHELASLRQWVRNWIALRDQHSRDGDDIAMAVDEVSTNGLEHGVPPARVRGWHVDGTLVVHITDRGTSGISPLAGYYSPTYVAPGGRGLWLARQVADVLNTHTTREGTIVRMTFPVPEG